MADLRKLYAAMIASALSLIVLPASAMDYPAPKQGDWIAKDFRFHTGEVMPEVRLHYTTVGAPNGEPVLILHGTGGSAAGFLTPAFAGELFGEGQPLDARKYFIILPDAIGAGQSTKPSDGLRAKFPLYNYADMVTAQHRLVTEGLGIKHLRLVIGNSMGGMQTWMWGETYPDFMDALVPMASQPTAMSSRNWMMRRMLTDSIRNDPDWKNGDYTTQPRAFRTANAFFRIATSGGSLAYQKMAPTREKADKLLNDALAAPFNADAEFAQASAAGARVEMKKHGLKLIFDKSYPPSTTDFTPVMRAVQAANADIVYAGAYPADSVGLVRAANEIGLTPKIFGGALIGQLVTPIKAQLGPIQNGIVIHESFVPSPKLNFPGLDDLMKRYQAKAAELKTDPIGYAFVPFGYTNGQILAQAVTETKSLDHEVLAKYIHTHSFQTVVGDLTFGKDGEWSKPRMVLTQFQNIEPNNVEQFKSGAKQPILWPPEYKTGEMIYPYADARKK